MKICWKRFLLRRLWFVALPLVCCLSGAGVRATELHHWVSQTHGIYENASAWVPANVPNGPNVGVIFGQQVQQTVGLQSDHLVEDVTLANKTNVTFQPAGLVVGDGRGENRQLSAENVTISDAFLRLKSENNIADAADVVLNVQDTINIDGKLNVFDGAQLNANKFNLGTDPNMTSSAWIAGIDSSTGPTLLDVDTMTIGDGTRASLRVNFGGKANSRIAYVGKNTPVRQDLMSQVDVNGNGINGPGVWDANAIVVGSKAMGQVTVEDGGIINAETLALGTGPSNEPEDIGWGIGAVTGVSGNGDRAAINANSLVVGVRGTGEFSVMDGGILRTNEALLARLPGSVATMNLLGENNPLPAEWINDGNVVVGGESENVGGAANIVIGENAIMNVLGELKVWPTSSLSVEGGTLAANRLYVHSGAQFSIKEGTLQLDEYEGVGLLQQGGTFAPGPGANTSIILEDFTQRGAARTAIEIGGLLNESYDRVAVDGDVIVNGTLHLDLIDSFVPSAEDTFPILSSNLLFGAYQNVLNGQRLETEDGSGSFVVNYGHQSIFDPNQVVLSDFIKLIITGDFDLDGSLTTDDIDQLTVGSTDLQLDLTNDKIVDIADRMYWAEEIAGTKFGDVNLDKSVDFKDFLVLSDSFGQRGGGWAAGDFDGNGSVGFPDFLSLSANFGHTGAASSVPEPTASLMAFCSLVGLAVSRRRR